MNKRFLLLLALMSAFLFSYAQEEDDDLTPIVVEGITYYLTDTIEDNLLLVYSQDEEQYATVRIDTGGRTALERSLSDYDEVSVIAHSNGQYLLCQNNDTCSYIYDYKSNKAYQTFFFGEPVLVEDLVYLGMRGEEPVFHDYGIRMLGLNGFFAAINAEGTGMDLENPADGILSLNDEMGGDVSLPLSDIPNAHEVYFDIDDYHKEILNYEYSACNPDGSPNGVSLFVCVPKLSGFKSDIKKNILYWIADCYAASKGTDRIGDITQNTSEKALIDDIKRYFTEKAIERYHQFTDEEKQEYHNESFKCYMMYGSADYASFYIEYHNDWDHIKSCYGATFDLKTNRRLTLSDIVNDEGVQEIHKILKEHYYNGLNITSFKMPGAITKNGLQFYLGEREASFEAVNAILIKMYNPDLIDYYNGLGSPFIPYSYLYPYLKINISPDCETPYDHIRLFVDPIKDPKFIAMPTSPQSHLNPKSQNEYLLEQTMNGGYNRNYAKQIQESDPELSSKIYSNLLEEFQTTMADNVIRSNYHYSNVVLARHLYEQGNLQAADSVCNSIIKAMPIDSVKPLTPNYCYYLVSNLLLGTNGDYYDSTYSIDDYSTEEGYNAYIDAIILLSRIRHKQGDIDRERSYMLEAATLLKPFLRDKMMLMPADLKNQLWQHYRNWLLGDLVLAAHRENDVQLAQAVYNALLLGKGLLLNTEVALVTSIMNSEDTAAKTDLAEYYRLKEEIEATRMTGKVMRMEELTSDLFDITSQLMNNLEFSNYMITQQITMEQVIDNLAEHEIAIEFADVKENGDTIYYAVAVNPKSYEPHIVRLCSIRDLRGIGVKDISNGNLYNIVWKPLEKLIGSSKTIFFSPAGILHSLPIEVAMGTESKSSLNSRFTVHRLSSTREIALARDTVFKNRPNDGNYGLIIGGLDFDSHDNNNGIGNSVASGNDEFASVRGGLQLKNILPLPATRKEIEAIKPHCYHVANIDSVVSLSSGAGTEGAFRHYSKYPVALLHIATHGFFLADSVYDNLDKKNYISILGRNYHDIEEKSLIRSGLLFAGVGQVLKAGKHVASNNDGIMTAMEISTLDLNGVDLAVLSACQTGLGDISDDGVLGLQRGFKKAGVHTILMSLWPVDDDATYLLMTKFYENLAKQQDLQQALAAAQTYLKESTKYHDPIYWAPFVLLDAIR